MTQLLENDEDAGPPPSDGLSLVGETKAFLKLWQRLMLGSSEWGAEQVVELRQRSRDLESRARAADVSSLAHHLQTCEHCFWNGEIDKVKLAGCLRNVSEVAWQWRQDLRVRSELYSVEGQGHVPHDRLIIEPPTLLTPPSVESFESLPPPPADIPEHMPLQWQEPPVDPFHKPSFLRRLFGSRQRSEGLTRPESRPKKKRKSPVSFPSLADAVYAELPELPVVPTAVQGAVEPPRERAPLREIEWRADVELHDAFDSEAAERAAVASVVPVASASDGSASGSPEWTSVENDALDAGEEGEPGGDVSVDPPDAAGVSPVPVSPVLASPAVAPPVPVSAVLASAVPASPAAAPPVVASPADKSPADVQVKAHRLIEVNGEVEPPRPRAVPRPAASGLRREASAAQAVAASGGPASTRVADAPREGAGVVEREAVPAVAREAAPAATAEVLGGEVGTNPRVAANVAPPVRAPESPLPIESSDAAEASRAGAATSTGDAPATRQATPPPPPPLVEASEVAMSLGVASPSEPRSDVGSDGPRPAAPPPPPDFWGTDAGASQVRAVEPRGNEAGASLGMVAIGAGESPVAGERSTAEARVAGEPARHAVEGARPRVATPPPLPPELSFGTVASRRKAEVPSPSAFISGLGAGREDPFAVPSRRKTLSWWGASLAVVCVTGALIWVLRETSRDRSVAPVAAASQVASVEAARAPATLGRQAIDGMVASAHGYGGIESPELADLLDEEAATLVRSGGACAPGTAGCELVSTAHGLSTTPGAASASEVTAERGSWLEGLESPGIGVRDDARVRRFFEFHTRNSVGREAFQELLFRCAGYRDVVQAALERYGVAPELLALPMATSGCVPEAESADAGRGLWQLTPAAAKAYHLRMQDQVVDERLDPVKATDAAVRLLEDLYRKTGSWDLAIAALRVGPLPLLARASEVGDGANYWALVDSGGLSGEAAAIVPKVQAFALILANLSRFRFQPVPPRAPEGTAALEVPPGTRLGLVARAAESSTTRIRELNPDLLGDRVPDWPGEKFTLRVPRGASEHAREVLPELIASADHADECVPHAFDWGRQRFTTAMAARCEHTSAMNH